MPCGAPPLQGKGEGKLKLGIQYRAVENIAGSEIETASKGVLLVSAPRRCSPASSRARQRGPARMLRAGHAPRGALNPHP